MELEKENIVLYLRFAEKLVQSIPCKIFFSFYKEIEYLTFFSPYHIFSEMLDIMIEITLN